MSQICCQFEERVNQPPMIIHPTSVSQKMKKKWEVVGCWGNFFSLWERESKLNSKGDVTRWPKIAVWVFQVFWLETKVWQRHIWAPLCSNLLSCFCGQAGKNLWYSTEYDGNPPNTLVICQIFVAYFAKYLSPAIDLFFVCHQAVYCSWL